MMVCCFSLPALPDQFAQILESFSELTVWSSKYERNTSSHFPSRMLKFRLFIVKCKYEI